MNIFSVSNVSHPPLSSGDDGGAERGLLHTWRGYSYTVTPERLLLPQPVLQVALGTRHGVLLVEGNLLSMFGHDQEDVMFNSRIIEETLSKYG